MLFLALSLFLARAVRSAVHLKCLSMKEYNIGESILVESHLLSDFGFGPSFPFALDVGGRNRTVQNMWVSSNVTYYCSFRMNGFNLSSDGKIFKRNTNDQVLFEDPTMSGPYGSIYNIQVFHEWNMYIWKWYWKKNRQRVYVQHDLVVPTRMTWDDGFNHISFQAMPLIGLVLEFHSDQWDKIVWHASRVTSAILNAMGVPMYKIVTAQPVEAKTLLLPWTPHWLPSNLAPVRGISKRACEILTKGLLSMEFKKSEIEESLKPLEVYSPTHRYDTMDDLASVESSKGLRYVVYIARNEEERNVYNETELLQMLSGMVDTSKVKLVVVGRSYVYDSVELLQRSWQRFARIFSRAIVMIGPHGGAWNNMVFTPSDCHFVEFNYLPDDPVYTTGSSSVRRVFLNAAWAKGGTGKFYNIEANNVTNKESPLFYDTYWMMISLRDVARTMVRINADIPDGGILKSDASAEAYPDHQKRDLEVPKEKKVEKLEPKRKSKPKKPIVADNFSAVVTSVDLTQGRYRLNRGNQGRRGVSQESITLRVKKQSSRIT